MTFNWKPIFDGILKVWWDNKWKKSKVLYNAKGAGNVDVRTVLYTSPAGWIELEKVAKSLSRLHADGSLDEDLTMTTIALHVNARLRYVPDIAQYGKNEFWADAYETYVKKCGDCDDYATLIKMLSLACGIPDWRVKCCCLDVKNSDGSPAGGHMNALYLERATNEWVFVEGSWTLPPSTYGDIWFTFNRENGWAQHTVTFDRYKLRKLKELGDSLG